MFATTEEQTCFRNRTNSDEKSTLNTLRDHNWTLNVRLNVCIHGVSLGCEKRVHRQSFCFSLVSTTSFNVSVSESTRSIAKMRIIINLRNSFVRGGTKIED